MSLWGAGAMAAHQAVQIRQVPSVTLASFTATQIHNAGHQPVTAVPAGSTVHDFVTVTGQPGQPNPTGNVNIDWFLNGTCDGSPAVNSGSIGPLAANGQFDAVGFAFLVNTAGFRAFRAHYEGDATYTPSDGACEALQVVDANIQITPNGVNRVGQTHTFTAHVNVNDGSGVVNAPDGTQISFSVDSGPGGFTSANPCTTAGGTGSCQVTLSSAVTGVSTVSAHTTVAVGGVALTRDTNGVGANSGPAVKTWVNAKISIAPNATNEVGQPHTFTVTLMKDPGTGTFVAAAGEHVDFTLTNSNGATFTLNAAASTCDDAGANTNAAGQCTIVINSTTAGKVTAHATSTLSVNGSAPFTVATDGVAPNSGDAVKTYVDANIQITPPTATNRVGQPHVFTAHVNVNNGTGGFVNAPDGTQISFTIDSGPGGFTTANPCTTAGGTGSCQITLSSAVTGVTTVSAHVTTSVGGVVLTRNTNGVGANSGPAVKTWVNAKISIAPNATNEVGQPHTFTVTLMKDPGTGTFVAAAGEHVDFTLTNSNGATFTLNAAASTCDDAGANTNAAGQCTIVINSTTAGKVTAHATSTLSVNGSAPFTVATDGVAPNSGDAVKTYVDANIQLTPETATNPVGTNHTLHCHINVDAGDGNGFVNAPAGTSCTVNILSGPGSPVSQICFAVGATGTCDVVITSATPGTSTLQATTTVSVGGVSVTRTTGDAKTGDGLNAAKLWADDTVETHVRDAANSDITGQTVGAGTVVHDDATVSKDAGTPATVPDPTGTVSFVLYDNGTCNGNVLATDPNKPLNAGTASSADFTTPAVDGSFSYRAHYNGDANYPAHDGPCGAFTVKATDDTVHTDIHDSAHNVITSANAGAVVHDNVQVTRTATTPAGVPDPTGNVIFHRYAGLTCQGSSTDETVALGAGGTAESSAFTISGDLSYQADYLGDVNYPAHTSACEPLSLNHFAHDVDAHLKMGGDIGLGASGTKVTDVKSDCKNETPAEFLRCTLQVSGLPAGCTAKSSAGPLASSPGGFLVDNFSGYAVNQTKHFDFKLTTTCTPNLAKDVVAILQFKVCADGGFIDPDPCVDTDITPDPSPNVVTKFVTLHR